MVAHANDSAAGRAIGRITVSVDFDEHANPELFALVTQVAAGKQRAQRIRSLMLMGYMFERVQGAPAPAAMQRATSAQRPVPGGADDVFGSPLES
jgi:hypothetical protein